MEYYDDDEEQDGDDRFAEDEDGELYEEEDEGEGAGNKYYEDSVVGQSEDGRSMDWRGAPSKRGGRASAPPAGRRKPAGRSRDEMTSTTASEDRRLKRNARLRLQQTREKQDEKRRAAEMAVQQQETERKYLEAMVKIERLESVHKQDLKRMKHEIRRLKAGSPPRKTIFDAGAGSGDGPTAAAAVEENEELKAENARLKGKIEQLVMMLEEAPRGDGKYTSNPRHNLVQ